MTQWVVTLAQVRMDDSTRVRAAIDLAVVATYGEQMAAGVVFPPITVFDDEGTLYLADGYHRCLAAQRCGWTSFPANVYPGTPSDALWYALGANRANGLTAGHPLKNEDKTHAIALALKTWPTYSNTAIARQLGCSKSMVGTVARRVSTSATDGRSAIRGYALVMRTRRDAVRAMVQAGRPVVEIRQTLHAHTSMIADVRRELGKNKKIDYSRKGVKARRAQIHQMATEGHTSRQIAADLGLGEQSVRGILKRDGIAVPADVVTRNTRHLDANRIMSRIVADAEDLSAGANLIDFAALDQTQFTEWLTTLQHARSTLGMFIRRITQEQSHGKDDVSSHRVQDSPGAYFTNADSDAIGDATGVP